MATLAGCYRSVVSSPSGMTPTGNVEVDLSPEGAAALVSRIGPRAEELEGRISSRSDSTLALLVTRVRRAGGTEEDWPSDEVAVPFAAMRELRSRQLSRSRSIAFAGASAVALFVLGRSLGGSNASGGRAGSGPNAGK